MNIVINESCPDDVSAIGALIRNELGYADVDGKKLELRLKRMAEDKNYAVLVAKADDETVGFLGLCRGIAFEVDGDIFRIIALAVDSRFQRRKIGTALLEAAENYARNKEAVCLTLNSGLTRTGAHAFYEHCGYRRKGYSFFKDF